MRATPAPHTMSNSETTSLLSSPHNNNNNANTNTPHHHNTTPDLMMMHPTNDAIDVNNDDIGMAADDGHHQGGGLYDSVGIVSDYVDDEKDGDEAFVDAAGYGDIMEPNGNPSSMLQKMRQISKKHSFLRPKLLLFLISSLCICCCLIITVILSSVAIGFSIQCHLPMERKYFERGEKVIRVPELGSQVPLYVDAVQNPVSEEASSSLFASIAASQQQEPSVLQRTRLVVQSTGSITIKRKKPQDDDTLRQVQVVFNKYAITGAKLGSKSCLIVDNSFTNDTTTTTPTAGSLHGEDTDPAAKKQVYKNDFLIKCTEGYSLSDGAQGIWGGALCSGTDVELYISDDLLYNGELDLELESTMQGVVFVEDQEAVFGALSASIQDGAIRFKSFTARNLLNTTSHTGEIEIDSITADSRIIANSTFGNIDIQNTRTSWVPGPTHPVNESIWNTVSAGSKYGRTTLRHLDRSNLNLYSSYTGTFHTTQSYNSFQHRHISFTFRTSEYSLGSIDIGCTKQSLCDMIQNSQPIDKDQPTPWLRNGSIINTEVKPTGYQTWRGFGMFSEFQILLEE